MTPSEQLIQARSLILEVAEWLDGLCVGHAVADRQRHELAVKLFRFYCAGGEDA